MAIITVLPLYPDTTKMTDCMFMNAPCPNQNVYKFSDKISISSATSHQCPFHLHFLLVNQTQTPFFIQSQFSSWSCILSLVYSQNHAIYRYFLLYKKNSSVFHHFLFVQWWGWWDHFLLVIKRIPVPDVHSTYNNIYHWELHLYLCYSYDLKGPFCNPNMLFLWHKHHHKSKLAQLWWLFVNVIGFGVIWLVWLFIGQEF